MGALFEIVFESLAAAGRERRRVIRADAVDLRAAVDMVSSEDFEALKRDYITKDTARAEARAAAKEGRAKREQREPPERELGAKGKSGAARRDTKKAARFDEDAAVAFRDGPDATAGGAAGRRAAEKAAEAKRAAAAAAARGTAQAQEAASILKDVEGDDLDAMRAKAEGFEDASIAEMARGGVGTAMTATFDALQAAAGRRSQQQACAWAAMKRTESCSKPNGDTCWKCENGYAAPDGIRELLMPKLSARIATIVNGTRA